MYQFKICGTIHSLVLELKVELVNDFFTCLEIYSKRRLLLYYVHIALMDNLGYFAPCRTNSHLPNVTSIKFSSFLTKVTVPYTCQFSSTCFCFMHSDIHMLWAGGTYSVPNIVNWYDLYSCCCPWIRTSEPLATQVLWSMESAHILSDLSNAITLVLNDHFIAIW